MDAVGGDSGHPLIEGDQSLDVVGDDAGRDEVHDGTVSPADDIRFL
jgi:hypothetical protein